MKMKKVMAFLLTVVLLFAVSAYNVSAALFSDGDWDLTSDNSGDKLVFRIHGYNGTDGDITLPGSYTGYRIIAIDAYAFAGNQVVTHIKLNSIVTEISDHCFNSARSLQEVVLNSRITSIGASAFSDTPALQTVHLEDTKITAIHDSTFLNSGIASVVIPKTCKSIGEYAFAQCANLVRVQIPDSVNKIAENAFNGCGQLVIACNYDSYAREYAVANGINYELLDAIEYSYVVGDSGGDGVIGIMDATIIQRMLVGLQDDPTGYLTLRGDAGSDGLSIYDATDIQRYLVGLPIESNVGERVTKVIYLND